MSDERSFGPEVIVGQSRFSVLEFLQRVVNHVEHPEICEKSDFLEASERFLENGLNAIGGAVLPEWVEYKLVPPVGPIHAGLHGAMAEYCRELLRSEVISDFFFMDKEPGLRIRFRFCEVDIERQQRADLESRIVEWQSRGIINGWSKSFYEPEQYLFGGPVSMSSVHRLFTADSLAWADYWSSNQPRPPAWAFSLSMIEIFFEEMRILGWEGRDVWDRVRTQTHRQIFGDKPDGWSGTLVKIDQVWADPGRLESLINRPCRDYLADYQKMLKLECPVWIDKYFSSSHARIGPREAAAFYIAYHWNRARIPFVWQCAIAEALAK
ncbi:thiopeptide-type bacteriocin biosynthesis domain-containing protein [Streptomyces sp. 2131.1]|uniref:thiopeptide-type bacteriocin biosynthesis protein n=1 Tax=Streptomyces sp. 2131.1 TaxID=1855346 RepID=UPI0008955D72|nr:thiopeptide-type bacteriocin biosynthesis protein [Streptomyces sp. 2131.1]SEC21032.1 thiopeptide-type bacteriocin biosynthesis domain-containing protein [Streptomyces sp. 2131.1]